MAIVMHLVILHILEELGLSEHSWRLKMCCSDTILGGHAYNLWLADDIEWYSIESTLGVTEAMRNWLSRPMRYNGLYQTIWFTFTKERTYADTDLMFDKADYFKKTGEN
jgi:hypothetical protein